MATFLAYRCFVLLGFCINPRRWRRKREGEEDEDFEGEGGGRGRGDVGGDRRSRAEARRSSSRDTST